LLQFREEKGIINLAEQKTSQLQELDRLQGEYIAASTEFSEAKAKLEELRTKISAQKTVLSVSPIFANNPEIKELATSLNNAEIELAGALEKFTEEDKSVKTLRVKISEIRNRMGKALKAIMQSDSAVLASIHPDMPKEYSKLTSDVAALAAKQDAIKNAIQDLEAEAFSLSKMETELDRLNRHKETNENLYAHLLDKYTQLEVQKAFQMSGYDVKIIDKASLSENARPDRPKWSLIIPLGFIGSLLLGFVMVFVMEYWDESFKLPQDVERKLDLDVLCTVPNMP
jgi:succinoglycan biosynthesis transport protein ExoP